MAPTNLRVYRKEKMVIFVDHNFSTVDHIKVGRGRDQNTFKSRILNLLCVRVVVVVVVMVVVVR